MQWRNEAGGYLREILTARVYDVAVRKQGGSGYPNVSQNLTDQLGYEVLLGQWHFARVSACSPSGGCHPMRRPNQDVWGMRRWRHRWSWRPG